MTSFDTKSISGENFIASIKSHLRRLPKHNQKLINKFIKKRYDGLMNVFIYDKDTAKLLSNFLDQNNPKSKYYYKNELI